ncbi:MAG: oligogalacturonate lyase family protein [Odoribacteraceae bacterium]|jgi:oligogalacturonide lyase|nr:oligogalacturonate lyase family protein [Odoribacteraceae bacterium]
MKTFLMTLLGFLAWTGVTVAQPTSTVPLEWIDAATGHKVVRLTRSGTDNKSFYFHNSPFIKSLDGKDDLMIYAGTADRRRQFFAVNLRTLESVQLTNRPRGASGEIVDKVHREVIYQRGDSIFATHVDTRQTRLLTCFPGELGASISTVNADGTLLAGKYSEEKKAQEILAQYPEKNQYFNRIYDAHIKHYLFTLNTRTGEMKVIHEENEWTNHIQFSPTDPSLLMFCHEGPWHKVDRIWTIDVNTCEYKLMHQRTMDMEIAGHEFFSPDGRRIWFDLQQPRSVTFFVAGVDVRSGEEIKYELARDEWSVHYNISPDQTLFCGDGGHEGSVAKAPDGKWIYLFRPDGNRFVSERLVNMRDHDYKLEPNVHFSPDQKWVIFRSNLFGETHVYAVEIEKAK